MANLDSIRALLNLDSPSNASTMSRLPRSYVQARSNPDFEMADQYLPGGDSVDFGDAQTEAFQQSGGTFAPSRESLRSSALSQLAGKLGITRRAQEHELNREREKATIAAAAQERAQRYQTDRYAAGQEAQDTRQERMFRQQQEQQQRQFDQQMKMQEDAQQFRVEHPPSTQSSANNIPAALTTSLAKAQKDYEGSKSGVGAFFRRLTGGQNPAQAQYEGALANYLQRKGSFAELNDGIAAIQSGELSLDQIDMNQFDPHERAYLKLKLGI